MCSIPSAIDVDHSINMVRLIDEHERIARAVAALRARVGDSAGQVDAVMASLRDLSIELANHLAYEDSFLYPMLADDSHDRSRADAAAFVTEFDSLRDDWTLYLREWTDDCVAADWDHFASVTLAMLDRLDLRVARENAILYPRAFRDGFIQFRDISGRTEAA